MNERRERIIRAVMITYYVIMTVGYSFGPILEGHDELQHFHYIHYLVTNGRLPERVESRHPRNWEFHQAPLYYVIGALIQLPIPGEDYNQVLGGLNEFAEPGTTRYGWLLEPEPGNYNKNLLLHTPTEAFPYTGSGTALAVHVLRLYSALLGLLTVLTCGAIYRLVWPNTPAYRLLALGITCAWPQFQYVSATISNDNMATLTATVCVYLCLRLLIFGTTWQTAGLIGASLGAAMLTKANGPLLVLPVATAYALSGRHDWHKAGLTFATTALLAGWWYIRNSVLYGDPSGLRAQYELASGLVPPGGHISLGDMPAYWLVTYRTLWARFGSLNHIPLSVPGYIGYDLLVILGAAGLALAAWQLRKSGNLQRPLADSIRKAAVLIILAASWIVGLSIFIYTNLFGGLGRLLLPGISAWSAGLAVGVMAWVPDRFREKTAMSIVGVMAILGVSALATVHAAYRPTPMPARIEVERFLVYDKTVQLVGVSTDAISARPGDTVMFSLYWRSLQSTDRNILIDIHSYGDDGDDSRDLIDINSYPGTGNWLSLNWLPDQYWAERYQVTIPSTVKPGQPMPILVFLIYADERQLLPIIGPGNRPVMFPSAMTIQITP